MTTATVCFYFFFIIIIFTCFAELILPELKNKCPWIEAHVFCECFTTLLTQFCPHKLTCDDIWVGGSASLWVEDTNCDFKNLFCVYVTGFSHLTQKKQQEKQKHTFSCVCLLFLSATFQPVINSWWRQSTQSCLMLSALACILSDPSWSLLPTDSTGSKETWLVHFECGTQSVHPIAFQVLLFLKDPPLLKTFSLGSFAHGSVSHVHLSCRGHCRQ